TSGRLKYPWVTLGPFNIISPAAKGAAISPLFIILIWAGNNGLPAEPNFSILSSGASVTICEHVSVIPYVWKTGIPFSLHFCNIGYGAGPPPNNIQRKFS